MQAFDVAQYKLDYPQFANISNTILIDKYNYIALAKSQWVFIYFTDVKQQYYWSCIVLSHILTIDYGFDGSGTNGLIGRINSASEDNVSASSEFNMPISNGAAWWNQTSYGAEIWSLWCSNGVAMYISGY